MTRAERKDYLRLRRDACEWMIEAGVDGAAVENYWTDASSAAAWWAARAIYLQEWMELRVLEKGPRFLRVEARIAITCRMTEEEIDAMDECYDGGVDRLIALPDWRARDEMIARAVAEVRSREAA